MHAGIMFSVVFSCASSDSGVQLPPDRSVLIGEISNKPQAKLPSLQYLTLAERIGRHAPSECQPEGSAAHVAVGRRICDIVCVQNRYNLAHRGLPQSPVRW